MIRDILARGRPSVSFEVFPPRADAPFDPVRDAVSRITQNLDHINNTVRFINIVLIPAFVVLFGIAWGIGRKLKWRRRTA